MSSETTKTLKFNQHHKFEKETAIISGDCKSLLKTVDERKSIRKKLCAIKVAEFVPSYFSVSMVSSFKSIKDKHDV